MGLKLVVNNVRTDFDKIVGVEMNPALTTLLYKYKEITEIFIEHEEVEFIDDSKLWEKVTESFNTEITVASLLYRYDADEEPTDDEFEAVNDVVEVLLMADIITAPHASAILSNMEGWNVKHLLKWIGEKEREAGI